MSPEISVVGEVEIYHDVQVWCETCGAGLCHTVTVKQNELHLPPCEKCMDEARDEAADNAYDRGYLCGESESSK